MQSKEIRERFLNFFEKKGHKIIPSSSLIPKNDPSVLFTTAGMQQFKKYYLNPELADKEIQTRNVASVQKCIRTGDIDEVGDNTHLTFFEMLGNFSFGGYGRKEAIQYAYEFITGEMNLKISYVTIYQGGNNVPRDTESEKIWRELGLTDVREEGKDVFWGPTGDSGPCGPTTEIYCQNASGQNVEIWNIVFNEYFCNGSREKLDRGEAKLEKLPVLGIDTGMGFERLVTIVQAKEGVYDTDIFNGEKTKADRIIVDHLRAAENMISDGVMPSNTGAGYVLRRLIRRAVRFSKIPLNTNNQEIKNEEEKFRQTLENGLKEFEKGTDPFILFTTYGFPIEMTVELAREKGQTVDENKFYDDLKKHQELSRTASAGMFKGGLGGTGEMETKYHTATHLLLAALRKVLGADIVQKGSNITSERLRFDFNWPEKLTSDQIKAVEDLVNEKIQENLPVVMVELPKEEAKKIVTTLSFDLSKYGDTVKVYKIGDFSSEFCGGPHVTNTSELGSFKIIKEEASSAGVRRIKAVLA
jgi:alanyl-tRNA synthetase